MAEKKKEKFNLKEKKENTMRSLFEVEHFLRDFKKFSKGMKLFHLMKK